jgi:hypothetical protein
VLAEITAQATIYLLLQNGVFEKKGVKIGKEAGKETMVISHQIFIANPSFIFP